MALFYYIYLLYIKSSILLSRTIFFSRRFLMIIIVVKILFKFFSFNHFVSRINIAPPIRLSNITLSFIFNSITFNKNKKKEHTHTIYSLFHLFSHHNKLNYFYTLVLIFSSILRYMSFGVGNTTRCKDRTE
jgi:hypothetical protein